MATTTNTTTAAPSAGKPDATKSSKKTTKVGRHAPTNWADYELGPYEKFPSQQQAVMDGYLMQRYDPTIGSALSVLTMLVGSHIGEYHHDDAKIEEFVRGDFGKISGGMRKTVNTLLSCIWAGYAVAERIWETEATAWHLSRLDLLHPLTFFAKQGGGKCGIELDKDTGTVTQVVQQPWQANDDPIALPIADVVYWPFQQQLREEVLGKRLTDRARRPWYMRVKMEIFWGVFSERFAHPTPIFRVPAGQQVDERGVIETNGTFYSRLINALAPGVGLAIECGPEDNFIFDLLESKGGSDVAYERVCAYYNAEAWKSVLMSPLILEEPAHSALGNSGKSGALETVIMLVEAIRSELGSVLVDQMAKPLVQYNFGENVEDFGEWKFKDLQAEDLEMYASIVERVVRSGGIVPTPEDEARLREKFQAAGFASAEELTPEDVAAQGAKKQLQLPVGYGS